MTINQRNVQPTLNTFWFFKPGYAQGVFWIVLVSLISNANDILMRFLGTHLASMQIAFFRFFFATLWLLPVMLWNGRASFKTACLPLHLLRALVGFGAVTCWCLGVKLVPLALVSTIALTVPLFVLPMAVLFLKERVVWQRVLATVVGFIGVLIVLVPVDQEIQVTWSGMNYGALILITAAVLFAVSDIFNKKMIAYEPPLTMLFYFALGTSVAGVIPAVWVWQTPTGIELLCLFGLGLGGNLILYCLLKAFAAVDVSALAPYRYLELIFAALFGYLLFGELITLFTLLGAVIIIPSTFAVAYFEIHQSKRAASAPRRLESLSTANPITESQ